MIESDYVENGRHGVKLIRFNDVENLQIMIFKTEIRNILQMRCVIGTLKLPMVYRWSLILSMLTLRQRKTVTSILFRLFFLVFFIIKNFESLVTYFGN